jgi:multiple sugar transport system permease protein
MKYERSAYVFILPSLIMFFALVFIPVLLTFIYSFQNRSLVRSNWVGFQNYIELLKDPYFQRAIKNTLTFVIGIVPLVVFSTFMVALQVAPLWQRHQVYFRAIFYLPVVTSGVVNSMVWLWIFNADYGLLTFIVTSLGLPPVEWLASSYTIYYLLFVVFTFNFGTPFIIYLAAMGNIPVELLEVARIDGAKKRTVTWKIVFPLLKPVTFFLFVTQTIFAFMVFVVIQLLTDGGPARSTETIIFMLYRTAFRFLEFGRASAMGVILLIIVLSISILQKIFVGRDNTTY